MLKNERTFIYRITICTIIVLSLIFHIHRIHTPLTSEVDPIEPTVTPFVDFIPHKINIPTPTKVELFYPIDDSERQIVECLVEGESGNQSLEGRILVAQCIYNACVQDDLLPSQVKNKYGYQGWSDNPSDETKEAVSAVFDRGEMGVEDNILWFCTIASSKRAKSFHATQEFVVEVGNHRFYKPMEN